MTSSENFFPLSHTRAKSAVTPAPVSAGIFPFNWWLVPLLVLGAMIVIEDGMTRPLILEEETGQVEALTYQPYAEVFAFAAVSLPLVMLYGRREKISALESLVLWFVFGTVAYEKDFAYVGIPGTRIYITDMLLAFLLIWFTGARRWKVHELGKVLCLVAAGWLICGSVAALRGLQSGQSALLVLRDSALVGYCLYLPIGFVLLSTWASVKRLFVFFTLGAVLQTLNALAWFLAQPGQRRYLSPGAAILAAFLGTIILTSHRFIRPKFGWVLSGLLGVGVLLGNARSIYVALAMALAVIVFVGPSARLRLSAKSIKTVSILAGVGAMVLWGASQTRVGTRFVERTETELISGTLGFESDPNAAFRFMAWLEAFHRFSEQPVAGEGFGVPFVFEFSDADPRPHNTYLTVLYKMGVTGLAPLLFLIVYVQWKGWKILRSNQGSRDSLLLYVTLIGLAVMCVFGGLNLLLESPFLASIFWLGLGICAGLTRSLNPERLAG